MRVRIIAVFIAAAICGLLLTGCTSSTKPISKTELLLDTFVTITLYGTKNEELLEEAMDVVKKYENMLSKTISGSDIYRINEAHGETIEVEPETIEVIQKALFYYDISNGNFDITVGGLTKLWNFKSDEGVLPDENEIKSALEHVGSNKIIIDENSNTIQLSDPYTSLDLGAIAKGYIADKVSGFLKANIKNAAAVIDLGGNILTVGKKTNGEKWTIGIQRPFALTREMLAKAKLDEKSVVSSGIYERYFYIGDTIYFHILDPKTGYPFKSDLTSVTIISDKSVDGEGISTTAFCLGLEKGLEFIESLPNVEAVFIPNEGDIVCSSGIGEDIPFEWVTNN